MFRALFFQKKSLDIIIIIIIIVESLRVVHMLKWLAPTMPGEESGWGFGRNAVRSSFKVDYSFVSPCTVEVRLHIQSNSMAIEFCKCVSRWSAQCMSTKTLAIF